MYHRFVPHPPPRTCHPRCPHFPPHRPIPLAHPLYPYLDHLYHHIACGAGGHRHRRHDALCRLIASAARDLLGAEVTTSTRLCSSSTKGTKVDVVITTLRRHPFTVALDATVSCPPLPSHASAAALSAATLFDARASEKEGKHLAGCASLGRAFIPVVFTTLLGIGPRDAREYIDSLYSELATAERLSGGTGSEAYHRRHLFIHSLQASLVRATARMAIALPARPSPPSSPSPAPHADSSSALPAPPHADPSSPLPTPPTS